MKYHLIHHQPLLQQHYLLHHQHHLIRYQPASPVTLAPSNTSFESHVMTPTSTVTPASPIASSCHHHKHQRNDITDLLLTFKVKHHH